MDREEKILCASSAYTRKFFINPEFEKLPSGIKDELKIMCVLFTEDIGGELELVFDEEAELQFRTTAAEEDLLYDEIGSVLKVKQLQREKSELLEGLETYYRIVFLGETFEEEK